MRENQNTDVKIQERHKIQMEINKEYRPREKKENAGNKQKERGRELGLLGLGEWRDGDSDSWVLGKVGPRMGSPRYFPPRIHDTKLVQPFWLWA